MKGYKTQTSSTKAWKRKRSKSFYSLFAGQVIHTYIAFIVYIIYLYGMQTRYVNDKYKDLNLF